MASAANSPITLPNSPQLYFNLDFRNVDKVDGDAAYRFYLGHGAIASLAFEASISSQHLDVRSGNGWETIASLETGTWYNLALTLDLVNKTYRGTLLKAGETEPLALGEKRSGAGLGWRR